MGNGTSKYKEMVQQKKATAGGFRVDLAWRGDSKDKGA